MRLVNLIAMSIVVSITMTPPPATAALENFEIDIKELHNTKQPQPIKQKLHKSHSKDAAPHEIDVIELEGESVYVVHPGEHLFKILMKQYGLSNPAAEQLIPEVMLLNGITSPKELKVGQRLRIPLSARASKLKAPQPTSGQSVAPAAAIKASSKPHPAASIAIVSAPACKLARDMLDTFGLLKPSPIAVQKLETVSASYAGRDVTVICGLSRAEKYTYERLLLPINVQLLAFEGGESDERIIEKISNHLGLAFRKYDSDSNTHTLVYIFSPFGDWSQELKLRVLPVQPPPAAAP